MGAAASPERVRRTYYLLSGLYTAAAALIWGVNTLFLLDAGLTLQEVFVANAFFTGGMVVFELPTGVVADTLGRRTSFLLSVAVLAASTLGYVGLAQLGAGLAGYAAVSVVMGLGFTFYSGATEAWLVDALHAVGFEGRLDEVFARGHSVTALAMLAGTLGGGLLGSIDLAVPFVLRTVLLLGVFAVAHVLMHDQGFQPRRLTRADVATEVRSLTRASIRFGWTNPSLRLFMLAGALQAGVMAWAWYAWQPYFLDLLGRDAVWVAGVVSAAVSLSMIAGNRLVEVAGRRLRRRTTVLLLAATASAAGAALTGLADSFAVAVAGLLVVTTARGLATPVRQAFFHAVVPSRQRATVLSFDSLVGNVGATGGQVTLGAWSQRAGVGPGYLVSAGVLAFVVPLVALVRGHDDEADRLRGEDPGTTPAFPAPGLPELTGVDSSVATGTATS